MRVPDDMVRGELVRRQAALKAKQDAPREIPDLAPGKGAPQQVPSPIEAPGAGPDGAPDRRRQAAPYPNEMVRSLSENPATQTVLGFGDALSNMMAAGASTLTGRGDQFEPIQSGEGGWYTGGNIAGSVAPFLLPGPHQATIPARIGTGMGAGALLSPEDPGRGALIGGAFSGAGESLLLGGKALKAGSEKITRSDYTKELMKKIKGNYDSSKKEALSFLDPLLENYGKNPLSDESALGIMEFFDMNKSALYSKSKSMYNKFEKRPTIENAQGLQSQLAKDARKIKVDDAASLSRKESIGDMREMVLGGMNEAFDQAGPNAAESYQTFRNIYARSVGPFEGNRFLDKVVHGETTGITPKKLDTELSKALGGDRSKVGQEHFLRQIQPEFSDKLARSELYLGGAGALAGGSLGGPAGALGGAAVPFMAKSMGYSLPDLLANDQLLKAMSQLEKGRRGVSQGATGLGVTGQTRSRGEER